jgi:cytochrome c peroxidase
MSANPAVTAARVAKVPASARQFQAVFGGPATPDTIVKALAACHAPPFHGNSTCFSIGLEHGKERPDLGRFNVTRIEAGRGAFRTPSLRSVALGAPSFRDRSAATLKDAVRHMASGGRPDPNKSPLLQPRGRRRMAAVPAVRHPLASAPETQDAAEAASSWVARGAFASVRALAAQLQADRQ